MEEVLTNRAIARATSKEMDEELRKRVNPRLVATTKHKEPFDGLNPSAQVLVKPLGELEGKSAVQVMHFAVRSRKGVMKDFAYVENVRETEVGGAPAAYVKAQYTSATAEGREFKTLSRMWIVPRGRYMFMLSMSGPPEGEDVSEDEFKAILESMKIKAE